MKEFCIKMLITESRLRRIIRSVIRESEDAGSDWEHQRDARQKMYLRGRDRDSLISYFNEKLEKLEEQDFSLAEIKETFDLYRKTLLDIIDYKKEYEKFEKEIGSEIWGQALKLSHKLGDQSKARIYYYKILKEKGIEVPKPKDQETDDIGSLSDFDVEDIEYVLENIPFSPLALSVGDVVKIVRVNDAGDRRWEEVGVQGRVKSIEGEYCTIEDPCPANPEEAPRRKYKLPDLRQPMNSYYVKKVTRGLSRNNKIRWGRAKRSGTS